MSEFWVRKMNTYFLRIDFDHDGVITRKDFEGMGVRFAETGKLSGDNAKNLCDKVCKVGVSIRSIYTRGITIN